MDSEHLYEKKCIGVKSEIGFIALNKTAYDWLKGSGGEYQVSVNFGTKGIKGPIRQKICTHLMSLIIGKELN